MSDLYILQLLDGRWMALPVPQFDSAISAGESIRSASMTTQSVPRADRRIVDSKGLAELLNVSAWSIEEARRIGLISSIKIGKLHRYDVDVALAQLSDNGAEDGVIKCSSVRPDTRSSATLNAAGLQCSSSTQRPSNRGRERRKP